MRKLWTILKSIPCTIAVLCVKFYRLALSPILTSVMSLCTNLLRKYSITALKRFGFIKVLISA